MMLERAGHRTGEVRQAPIFRGWIGLVIPGGRVRTM